MIPPAIETRPRMANASQVFARPGFTTESRPFEPATSERFNQRATGFAPTKCSLYSISLPSILVPVLTYSDIGI